MSEYPSPEKNITFTWPSSRYNPLKSIKVGKEGGKIQKFETTKTFFIIFETLSVGMRKFNSKK